MLPLPFGAAFPFGAIVQTICILAFGGRKGRYSEMVVADAPGARKIGGYISGAGRTLCIVRVIVAARQLELASQLITRKNDRMKCQCG